MPRPQLKPHAMSTKRHRTATAHQRPASGDHEPSPVPAVSTALIDAIARGDAIDVYDIIQRGMPKKAFGASTVESFLEHLIMNTDARRELRRALVPERSWKRRKAERTALSGAELSRLAAVGHLVRQARRLWQDDATAEKFLTTPHPRLHGKEPIQVAAMEAGLPAVLELLQRIEEGAPV